MTKPSFLGTKFSEGSSTALLDPMTAYFLSEWKKNIFFPLMHEHNPASCQYLKIPQCRSEVRIFRVKSEVSLIQ